MIEIIILMVVTIIVAAIFSGYYDPILSFILSLIGIWMGYAIVKEFLLPTLTSTFDSNRDFEMTSVTVISIGIILWVIYCYKIKK